MFSSTTGAKNHSIIYSLEHLMLAIQQTKLLPREAGGESPPPYEKGVAKRFWGVKNDRGFSRMSGGKRYG